MLFNIIGVLCCLVVTINAVGPECTINTILVPSIGGKFVFDLNVGQCVIMNQEIKNSFAGTKDETCSWNNVFFRTQNKPQCPAHFHRKMTNVGHITKLNGRLIANPIFFVHVCRLGGAYFKTYEHGGTCALEQGEDIPEEQSKYLLTKKGVEVCREARSKLIDRCTKTYNPTSRIATTRRTPMVCAERFKLMLMLSSPSRSRSGTVPKFKDSEAGLLMPELLLPFDVENKETWIATTSPTGINTGKSVVFRQGDSLETLLAGVNTLFKPGRHGVLTKLQRGHFLNATATALFQGDTLPVQMTRINKLVGGFIQKVFNNKQDAVRQFIQSKSFAKIWRDLSVVDLKEKVQSLFKRFSTTLKALQPFISHEDWHHIRQGSVILDNTLQTLFGRKFILYSISTVTKELKKIQKSLNVWTAPFKPKKKSTSFLAAFMDLSSMTAMMYSEETPFTEMIEKYSKWLLVKGRLVFEITSGCSECPSFPPTNLDYYNEENRQEACSQTRLKDMCALCPPTENDFRAISRCKRQSKIAHQTFDVTGKFKHANVQIQHTKGKEENLVVFVDVPFGIWLAVMELKMVTVSDKQQQNIHISDNDRAVAETIMPFFPKEVYDTNIHCDGDSADINRASDSQKGYSSLNMWSCVTKFTKESGLTKNKKLVMWIAMLPGKDNYENNNGYFHAGGGFRMLREAMTTIIIDFKGNYWGSPLSFVVDSMCAEAICGGYGCRGVHDIPGCPECCRDNNGIATSISNLGGTTADKVYAYRQDGCGINRLMVGAEMLKKCQKDTRRVIGVELLINELPGCSAALKAPRGNPVNFKAAAGAACKILIKISQPSYKFDRESRTFLKAWGTPKINKVVAFWCPKSEKSCNSLALALSSAFFVVPDPLYTTPDTDRNPTAPLPTPRAPSVQDPVRVEGEAVEGEAGAVADPVHVQGGAGAAAAAVGEIPVVDEELIDVREGEGDGDDEENHGAGEGMRNPDELTETTDFIQLEANKGGYIVGLPSVEKILFIENALKHYLAMHQRIGLGLTDARAKTLQYYIQNKAVREHDMSVLDQEIASAPTSTREERKKKKILVDKKKNMVQLKTPLRGLDELVYLLERDEDSTQCDTPKNSEAEDLIKAMKKVINFQVTRDTETEQKKVRGEFYTLVSNHRQPKLPRTGKKNPLSRWRDWAKGENVMYQKFPLLLGPIQFDQKKLGQCAYPGSFHSGLRCPGSSFTMFVIQELQLFDKQCTVRGVTRMNCLKKEVEDKCGTWIGNELNGGSFPRQKIKKNGGAVFEKCTFNMDLSKCFKPEVDRTKILDVNMCLHENVVKKSIENIQRGFRFTHWFDFRTDDRERDFGYAVGDTDTMREDKVHASAMIFEQLKELRPTTTLQTMRKNKDGGQTVSERPYTPFMTRNCRYVGSFMLALFDEGVETNELNEDLSERSNGDLRRLARHHTMRNKEQVKQLLVAHATTFLQYINIKGTARRFAETYKKNVPKIATKWNPKKILKEMREAAKAWEEGDFFFPDTYVPASKYLRNQELSLEDGEEELAGWVEEGADQDEEDTEEETEGGAGEAEGGVDIVVGAAEHANEQDAQIEGVRDLMDQEDEEQDRLANVMFGVTADDEESENEDEF